MMIVAFITKRGGRRQLFIFYNCPSALVVLVFPFSVFFRGKTVVARLHFLFLLCKVLLPFLSTLSDLLVEAVRRREREAASSWRLSTPFSSPPWSQKASSLHQEGLSPRVALLFVPFSPSSPKHHSQLAPSHTHTHPPVQY